MLPSNASRIVTPSAPPDLPETDRFLPTKSGMINPSSDFVGFVVSSDLVVSLLPLKVIPSPTSICIVGIVIPPNLIFHQQYQ